LLSEDNDATRACTDVLDIAILVKSWQFRVAKTSCMFRRDFLTIALIRNHRDEIMLFVWIDVTLVLITFRFQLLVMSVILRMLYGSTSTDQCALPGNRACDDGRHLYSVDLWRVGELPLAHAGTK
jgi:hypothetical protein